LVQLPLDQSDLLTGLGQDSAQLFGLGVIVAEFVESTLQMLGPLV
jgi:hypothetical protein